MNVRRGRRVLVSGMGGDLGSRVAVHLEREPWVGELLGIDTDPPRRRLQRAEFHLASPQHHDRILALVNRFNPHVIVHMSVWEPFSRANPRTARLLTLSPQQVSCCCCVGVTLPSGNSTTTSIPGRR